MLDLECLPRRAQQHRRCAQLADAVDGDDELGRFVVITATRSPAPTPRAARWRANALLAQSISAKRPPLLAGPERIAVAEPVRGALQTGVEEAADTRGALAQDVLLHLAGGVQRQRVDDLDRARHLVVRHLLAAPPDDAGRIGGPTRAQHDERHTDLAQPLVGDADHRGLLNVGVAKQRVLDLGRVGVEAAHDEHVLRPADDAQAAALVDHAEVAGAQPAVGGERRGGRLRVVEVASHHGRASQHDLPGSPVATS